MENLRANYTVPYRQLQEINNDCPHHCIDGYCINIDGDGYSVSYPCDLHYEMRAFERAVDKINKENYREANNV